VAVGSYVGYQSREALSRSRWVNAGTAAWLGASAWLGGVVLTGAAAWLLVRASSRPPVLTLSAAVVLVRASAVARPLLRYAERLVSHEVAFARLGARRARVYAALIPRVPGPRLHRRGDLLTRVVDDVDAQVDGLLRGRLPAWSSAIALAVAAITAAATSAAVGAVTGGGAAGAAAMVAIVAGMLLAVLVAPRVAGRLAVRRERATAVARARLRDALVETVDGVEELASAADSPARRSPVSAAGPVSRGGSLGVPENRSWVLARLEARAARAAGLATGWGYLGWGFVVAGVVVATWRLGGSAEWAAVWMLGTVALGEVVTGLPDAAVARRRAAAADARLAELITDQVSDPRPAQHSAGRATADFAAGLVVQGLVAGWGDEPALKGLDLVLPAGGRLAIVGASGSGKSTLAAVLARLLEPHAGTITLGGTDLGARHRIGLVSDDTDHVFAATVRDNLRLAKPTAGDPELTTMLSRAGVPLTLDTWLGTGGTTMSGGQRRRLATARALLADPELLILDEPTEGLDEQGAEALMADLLTAADGRSVLVLAHRTEGLDRVDAVLEMRDGHLETLTTAQV
jgi:ATP-binding cassette subfamily C protein CydCD